MDINIILLLTNHTILHFVIYDNICSHDQMRMSQKEMGITLVRANIQDAEDLWKMQIVAFQDLYAKHQDPETSPATETLEKTMTRLEQPYT